MSEPNPDRTGKIYPPGEGPRCLMEGCDEEAQWCGLLNEYRVTCEDHCKDSEDFSMSG